MTAPWNPVWLVVAAVAFGFLPALRWSVAGGLTALLAFAFLLFILGMLTMGIGWVAALTLLPVAALGGWVGLAARLAWSRFRS